MKKMEPYFYIVSPKRAHHILYFEQDRLPSFEESACPVPHRRFFARALET